MASNSDTVSGNPSQSPFAGFSPSSAASSANSTRNRSNSARSQFDRYMHEVKKTPLLGSESLIALARQAYKHKYELMKTLSQFPPCVFALKEQFDYHTARDLKLYNFARAYGDQSLQARDDIHAQNQGPDRGQTDAYLYLKANPANEARLRGTLDTLSHYCQKFSIADPATRCSSRSIVRRRMADIYLHVVLRNEEYERHCALFEQLTADLEEAADGIVECVDPINHRRLFEMFGSSSVRQIRSLIPESAREAARCHLLRLKKLVAQTGISVRETIRLKAQYDYQKTAHRAAVNKIVQANLLLAARETIRLNPSEDRLFDTCQEANEGLITAAYRFEYWKGFAFSTYACHWIKQRLRGERASSLNGAISVPLTVVNRAAKVFRAQSEIMERDGSTSVTSAQVASELRCSVKKVDEALRAYTQIDNSDEVFSFIESDSGDASESATARDIKKIIREALETLPEKKREICKMRFGIDYPDRMTLAQVSGQTGITKERVRNIEQEALELLRNGKFSLHLTELYAW